MTSHPTLLPKRSPVGKPQARRRTWWLLLLAVLLGACTALGPLTLRAEPLQIAQATQRLNCLGDTRSLIVSSGMPYTPVRVQGRTGFFVVDLGADGSAISPTTFLGGQGPRAIAGSASRFDGFDFFGLWDPVTLKVQDHSGIKGPIPQAGLIGTDLINHFIVTIDYANGLLHRASRDSFCSDDSLRQAGFQPLSSRHYYGNDVAALRCPSAPKPGKCPNIPSIPVRIGRAEAVAQVDTGYDDAVSPPSMNINRAWFEQLQATGMGLQRRPDADLRLSTCAGVTEPVLAYRLPPGAVVELVGSDGRAVRSLSGVTLFLKDTPPAARGCGGIGTWQRPAAQLGASFVNDGTLVVDPFSQRVWLRAGDRAK